MTQRFRRHAVQIVEDFKGFLDENARAAVGEENFQQLSMMIESAISTSLLEKMEQVAGQVVALGNQIQRNAEHFDK